ncbi:hypothetical protein EVAR_42049_1 [Eumeta japonica]|uniref:Uncharacterized protein n=1 Tax=Eumeta variegata TaxID=151549 RepID=A0A4C1XVN7_EUMVA|nr:hypothetical protein EVAR_42049_1 [Eumeta japonica]
MGKEKKKPEKREHNSIYTAISLTLIGDGREFIAANGIRTVYKGPGEAGRRPNKSHLPDETAAAEFATLFPLIAGVLRRLVLVYAVCAGDSASA